MESYRDWDNDSGIRNYEIGDGFIVIEFKDGQYRFYKYTDTSAGSHHITAMQQFARCGDGLNAYIGEHKPRYAAKGHSRTDV